MACTRGGGSPVRTSASEPCLRARWYKYSRLTVRQRDQRPAERIAVGSRHEASRVTELHRSLVVGRDDAGRAM